MLTQILKLLLYVKIIARMMCNFKSNLVCKPLDIEVIQFLLIAQPRYTCHYFRMSAIVIILLHLYVVLLYLGASTCLIRNNLQVY